MNAEVGTVVQLKSGGTAMTIEAVEGDAVDCVWADKGRIRRDRFPLGSLKPSKDDSDFTIIIEGMGASAEEIAEFKGLSGNA